MAVMGRIVFICIAAVMIWPTYMMVIGSFEPMGNLLRMPPYLVPHDLTLKSYEMVLGGDAMPLRWAINTIILAAGVIAASLMITALAGYAFATFEFWGKRMFFGVLLIGIFVHRYMLIIPQFVMLSKLGIGDTLLAAGLPLLYFPTGIYLFRNYLASVSSEIVDAAKIDGCGDLRTLIQIIMPLCGPMVALFVMGKGIEACSDFLWQTLALQRLEVKTWIVGLMGVSRSGPMLMIENTIGLSFAIAVLIAIPCVALYFATSKMFLGGINVGGIKG